MVNQVSNKNSNTMIIIKKLLSFRKDRDWSKFHKPQNIVKSIVLEAAELLEVFQWTLEDRPTKKQKEEIEEELADIYNWTILLAHDLNIDIERAALKKIQQNETKYPVSKFKGKAKKYTTT